MKTIRELHADVFGTGNLLPEKPHVLSLVIGDKPYRVLVTAPDYFDTDPEENEYDPEVQTALRGA